MKKKVYNNWTKDYIQLTRSTLNARNDLLVNFYSIARYTTNTEWSHNQVESGETAKATMGSQYGDVKNKQQYVVTIAGYVN